MKYQKIGVYLSSKADLPESYTEAAQKVGELIGRTGRTLVYGGARKGLMETLAQSVKANGGRVFGMVPDIIVARGLESEAVDVTFRCVDLTDRKAMMNRESDVLVALPGGIGTLDEVFTVLANSAIGIERKPVISSTSTAAGTNCSKPSTICADRAWYRKSPANCFKWLTTWKNWQKCSEKTFQLLTPSRLTGPEIGQSENTVFYFFMKFYDETEKLRKIIANFARVVYK